MLMRVVGVVEVVVGGVLVIMLVILAGGGGGGTSVVPLLPGFRGTTPFLALDHGLHNMS